MREVLAWVFIFPFVLFCTAFTCLGWPVFLLVGWFEREDDIVASANDCALLPLNYIWPDILAVARD